MPDIVRRYTADEVLAFPPDANRYEVTDGELLVTPSPAQKHEIARWRLAPELPEMTVELAAIFAELPG